MTKEKQKKQTSDTHDESEVVLLKSQLARTLADYDNLQKRVARDRAEMLSFTAIRFLSRFLPIFDMIDDAQKHLQDPGLGISLKVLSDTLKEEGVIEIEAKDGMIFDEQLHEAVDTTEDSARQNGEIVTVLLKGYRLSDGPIIRHAKVKVNKIN